MTYNTKVRLIYWLYIMKPYTLFLQFKRKSNNHIWWYGWKSYRTPEIAIGAFKNIRKDNPVSGIGQLVEIEKVCKIVGNGSATFYEDV